MMIWLSTNYSQKEAKCGEENKEAVIAAGSNGKFKMKN